MMALLDTVGTQDALYYVGREIKDLTLVMWLIAAILATINFRMK